MDPCFITPDDRGRAVAAPANLTHPSRLFGFEPRAPLLTVIAKGLSQMPTRQARAVGFRMVVALRTGVALLMEGLPEHHPICICALEIGDLWSKWMADLDKAANVSVATMISLVEVCAAKIWRLSRFQPEGELKSRLILLVEPICEPIAPFVY